MSSDSLNALPTASQPRILIFGGTGAIGSAIVDYFREKSWNVVVVTRQATEAPNRVFWDPNQANDQHMAQVAGELKALGPFDAVCWAQGVNCTDSLYAFDMARHMEVYTANVAFILNSLSALLTQHVLNKPARLCVLSSIWQKMARQSKLSYCVSKAALQGLVLSAAADLAAEGHVINAVLPGVIETPMTRDNLSSEQISKITQATQFNRLTELKEIAACVFSLCQAEMSGVTGQFIEVDLGFSNVRII